MNSTEWAKHLYMGFRGWGRYSTYGMCSMHSMDILKMCHYPANVFFIPQMQYFNLCVTSFVYILGGGVGMVCIVCKVCLVHVSRNWIIFLEMPTMDVLKIDHFLGIVIVYILRGWGG